MADISKINAVALANIAKLDAVLAANIAKVNGLVFTTAAPGFLLDTYTGAAAGYSVRRIASSATNLMRIREDSGDTETDIGYDSNGDLDLAAIASHCGTANGFVVSWVDQSGNGNDADQSTNANQPKIYDGTTQAVFTENGKPSLQYNNAQDLQSSVNFSSANLSVFTVNADDATTGNDRFWLLTDSTNTIEIQALYHQTNGDIRIGYRKPENEQVVFGTADNAQHLLYYNKAGTASQVAAVDGGSTTSNTATVTTLTITELYLGSYDSQNFFDGRIQEVVLWDTDQTTNRTGIETDINSEYLIYQPTDAPTSGLLATYTGAAAAYSVRQLSDKAVIALRIRRDSDDEETNIGWDTNGDLATADIADFCGTANGYVTRWWDQSTNGNHASQGTAGSQPQIYNGTAVITENGKPALDFANDQLDSTISLTSNQTIAAVVTSHVGGIITLFSSAGGVAMGRSTTPNNAFYQSSTSGDSDNFYGTYVTDNQQLHFVFRDGTTSSNSFGRVNQTQGALNIDGTGDISGTLKIGQLHNLGYRWNGFIQELIFWDNESSNKTDIETDINTYFSIY